MPPVKQIKLPHICLLKKYSQKIFQCFSLLNQNKHFNHKLGQK